MTKFEINTDYKIFYNNYSNIDFNNKTSSDTYDKLYSNLNLNFKTIIENFEFNTTLCSLEEPPIINNSTHTKFLWEKNLNYYFLNNLYFSEFYAIYKFDFDISLSEIKNIKINFSLGRKRKNFVEGLVVGDNIVGYNGLFLEFFLGKYIYIDSMLSKIYSSNSFLDNRSFNLKTFLLGSKYFEEFDFGICYTLEDDGYNNNKKIFYEIFLRRELPNYYYLFEYAIQTGKNNDNLNYSGSLWFFKASAFGKSRFLGSSKAEVVWLLSSGGQETSIFSPNFSKIFEGKELYGWGNFARGNVKTLFFDLPLEYSGMFILGFNLSLNPINNLITGIEYYLYSSPEAPFDKPDVSATEKTLGAKKAIGVEYGINFKYKISKYIDLKIVYSIFVPSKNVYSKTNDAATKFSLSSNINF